METFQITAPAELPTASLTTAAQSSPREAEEPLS